MEGSSAFLEDIHGRFVRTYGQNVHTALAYGMNDECSRVLSQQMEYYSSDRNADRINRMRGEMSQAYTINGAKVVVLKKRPQNRHFKGAGNYCSSCERSLQEPYIHCSLGSKVEYVLKQEQDLSAYLLTCKTLQLSPDFLAGHQEYHEETPESPVVDEDEGMGTSSGSDNASLRCTPLVRKKRSSGAYMCGRSAAVKVTEEDIVTSMSRRKGVPQRSPVSTVLEFSAFDC